MRNKNNIPHRTTKRPPIDLKKEEKLKPLPFRPWLNRIVHSPTQSSKTGLVTFDTNQYSVPEYLVGKTLQVHAFCDHLEICSTSGKKLASHPRSFERYKTFLNPLHRSFKRILPETKARRIYNVIKKLDPACEKFINLSEKAGEDSYLMADFIFSLLRMHARRVVMSALREALSKNIIRPAFIQSLLEENALSQEAVYPGNRAILSINYKPRSLKEYD